MKTKIKKTWTEFKAQFRTWNEAIELMIEDRKKLWRWVKKLPKRLYGFIDKGEPSWLSLFGLIRITITIPIKSIYRMRQKRKYLLSFLPSYYKIYYEMFFLHTDKIPKNSNAVLELKKLKILMENHGFMKDSKITSDEDTFRSSYTHNKHGQISMFIYIDDFCDIEYVDVMKQEPVMTGMCAKVLEELNSN